MPCVCLFFSLAVKPGRCTVDTSKLLKPITLSHCRKLLLFTGGKVPHTEMRSRANTRCMEHLVMKCQLRWIGHVIRMQSNRLPCRILYSEQSHGQQVPGGQKKRFSDQVKAILKKCSIPPDQPETLASDREAWKDVCEEGLTAFDINYDQEAEAHCARRHTVTSTPASGPRCHICGRICVSEFGLRSHLRFHRLFALLPS